MKRISKLALLVLGFAAGGLAGAFIRLGFEILAGRPTSVGGEALILPLIVLLVCFGYSVGKEIRAQRIYERGYHDGYKDGKEQGKVRITFLQGPGAVQAANDRTGQ